MKEKDVKFSEDSFNANDKSGDGQVDINSDENMAGINHLNDELEDETELDRVKQGLQAQKDKYLRLFADFDNFKKRTARENIELRQTAGKEIITALLDVLDDTDRAEKQLQKAERID